LRVFIREVEVTTSVRITDYTKEQVDALKASGMGTIANVIAIAIDRMYQEEQMTIEQAARQRVEDTELIYISNLIFSDWDNMEEHLAWIVQADINEILDWARDLGYLIHLSGDIEQMQEQAWDGNVGQSVDDFMLDYDSIEDSVDDYLDQYEDMFQEPIPTYYGELTQSYYSLRELLVGYLKRMYV
jgi:hypothetical protein